MDHENPNYPLLQDYYKLRQKIITNYGSFITNYNSVLLQITAKIYHKFRQKVLQITAAVIFEKFKIITNYVKFYYIYGSFKSYYKLRQILFQITADFYYKLRQILQITTLLQITS